MKILNPEYNLNPLQSLLNRKIQFEIDGLEFAVLRALVGGSAAKDNKLVKITDDLLDTLEKAVPIAEYTAAIRLITYDNGITLTMHDNNLPE